MDKNIIFFNESQEMTEQYNLYSNWWQFPNLWKWSNDKMAAKKLLYLLGRAAESASVCFSRPPRLKVTLRAQTLDQIMFMVILTWSTTEG